MGSANRKFQFGDLFVALFLTVLVTGFVGAVVSKCVGTQHDREVEANNDEKPAQYTPSGGSISAHSRDLAAALWKEVYFKTFEKTGLVNTSLDAANDAVRNTYGK